MKNCILVSIVVYTLMIAGARAEYCAVGPIKGNVCKRFVIESCKFVQVDAIKGEDDRLYTIMTCYKDVSEYDESQGRCWIRTKTNAGGALSWAYNALEQPEFYHKNEDGRYEEIDVEYVMFKCVRR